MPIKKWLKRILFSLTPLILLILSAEVFFRVTGLADSPISSPALPGETHGLNRHDPELFWSLRPNVQMKFQGVTVTTNALGLRSGPVHPKRSGEFRILSLGESTTFGANVEDDQTYSKRLEQILNGRYSTDRFTVINAGVSAYTSFQSLLYLQQRGFDLSPDLVLFYHEYNDYLPTHVRDSENHIIGMNMSDKERYRSQQRKLHRGLIEISAVYRYLCYRVALSKMRSFQVDHTVDRTPSVLVRLEEESYEMPVRVRPEERTGILEELISECRNRGVRLVIIHPSYAESVPHRCVLTDVCRQGGVPMFEAYPVLHPRDTRVDAVFSDPIHPSALGHELLAQALAAFLVKERLLLADRNR